MRIWRWAAVVIAAVLTLTLIDRFVLVELLLSRIGAPLVLAALETVAIVGAGALARRMRGDLVVDFIVGYPIFGTVCFLTGLVKIGVWTMIPLVVLFAIAGLFAIWTASGAPLPVSRTLERPYAAQDGEMPSWRAANTLGLVAIAVVLLCGAVAAQAPPGSLDEVAYHLAVPHTWVLEGRAVDLPLISHSYFPLGIESADLPLLASLGPVTGGMASHLLHLIAALATTMVVFRTSGRDWLVTAAIVTTPAIALTAGWSLVDWPLLGVCVVLARALLREDDYTTGVALAAGLLTKYTFIPFAIVALLAARRMRGVLPGLAGGSIFFLRNLVLTHDPIAPFLGANAPHVSGYRALTLGSYVFDGRFVDESLGASLLASSVLTAGAVGFACLGAGVVLFAMAPSARLLVPFFGFAATQSAARVDRSRTMQAVLAIAIAVQVMLVAWFVDRTNVFSLISAKSSDEQYVLASRPANAAIEWLNSALPPRSRTLVIGVNETYWFDHPVRGGGNFDGPRLSSYLDVPTPEALRSRLARDGITHVAVIDTSLTTAVASKVEERQTTLSRGAQRALAQMLDRYAASVNSRANATLFALR